MKNLLTRINNTGDTIVEVLIAIAIVSLVLGGAYVSTNRSFQTTRTAQERGEALKLAESQVEAIRQALEQNSPNVVSIDDFCIDGGTLHNSPCELVVGGVTYNLITEHQTGQYVFSVKVDWDRLGGGTNFAQLDYETQAPLAPAVASVPSPMGFTPAISGPAPGSGPGSQPPVLKYIITLTNNTDAALGPRIVRCEWDWKDGSIESVNDASCKPGGTKAHCYWKSGDPQGQSPPAPFNQRDYPVTLKIYLDDGSSATSRAYDVKRPYKARTYPHDRPCS